jgi:general secretion pathway protein L
MSNKILSIDVRDDAIAALLISSTLKGNCIESHCHVRLDHAPSEVENKLSWAISRLADEIDISGTNCILSVSPAEVTYRNVKLPFKERRKIGQLLPFELESGLPCAVEELSIDFSIVRKSDYSDIFAAAVKNEKLDEMVGILHSFDIRPRYISVGPIAEAMCIAKLGTTKKSDNFLFISMDDVCATVCLVSSGKLHLARTFRLPKNDAPQRIKRLKQEILRITAAFENIYAFDFNFDQVMISSVSSGAVDDDDMGELVSTLTGMFGVDVTNVDIFNDANLKILSCPDDASFEHRLFNSALGLAGIEIGRIAPFNFSRDHYSLGKYWEDNRREFITAGVFFLLVFILIMTNTIIETRFLEKQTRKIDNEIHHIFRSTLPGDTRIVDPLHQMRVEIDRIRQRSALTQTAGSKISNIEILREISRLIPNDIDLLISNMVRSDNQVTLSGTISDFNAVDEVKVQLEKAGFFERITISSANMDNSINRVRFRIRVDLAG